ncbi:MAG TPA: OpgC domain-containing protein [Hyphomicrobiaceae bacterium]|nr:OpgC domain-containing protein [Hyphomicrobiaceae bacterium]
MISRFDRAIARAEHSATPPRDLRIDFFRGLALICIFIDHVPGNKLAHITLRNFGLCDASELFVLLAGFSAALAYGRAFRRDTWKAGLARVGRRIAGLYAAHLLLLAVCVGGLAVIARALENPVYFEHVNLTPFDFDPFAAIWRALVLQHQPAYLDILPLYMLLLAWFCVLIALARVHAVLAVTVSAALWAVAHFKGLNLPSYPDPFGWYFNPMAWQFLFSLGVLAGLAHRTGTQVPRSPWLCGAAIAYLLFAFLVAGPWTQIPGWQDQELLPRDLLGPISKQNLSTWRLANILALAYLSASVIPASASWMRNPFLGWVTNLGRNALEVFCAGTILSLVGFIVLVEVDRGWVTQLAVNFGGLLAMGLTAWWAGKRRRRRRNATDNSAASTSAILSTPSSTRRAAAQETALLHARIPSSVQPRGR